MEQIAREFGIPAVANVHAVLEQVRTGDVLDVDARFGVVKRVRS